MMTFIMFLVPHFCKIILVVGEKWNRKGLLPFFFLASSLFKQIVYINTNKYISYKDGILLEFLK